VLPLLSPVVASKCRDSACHSFSWNIELPHISQSLQLPENVKRNSLDGVHERHFGGARARARVHRRVYFLFFVELSILSYFLKFVVSRKTVTQLVRHRARVTVRNGACFSFFVKLVILSFFAKFTVSGKTETQVVRGRARTHPRPADQTSRFAKVCRFTKFRKVARFTKNRVTSGKTGNFTKYRKVHRFKKKLWTTDRGRALTATPRPTVFSVFRKVGNFLIFPKVTDSAKTEERGPKNPVLTGFFRAQNWPKRWSDVELPGIS